MLIRIRQNWARMAIVRLLFGTPALAQWALCLGGRRTLEMPQTVAEPGPLPGLGDALQRQVAAQP